MPAASCAKITFFPTNWPVPCSGADEAVCVWQLKQLSEDDPVGNGNPPEGAKPWGQKEHVQEFAMAQQHRTTYTLARLSAAIPIVQSCKRRQPLTNDAVPLG